MQKELDNMLERFPGQRKTIIDLYNSNEDFKALCEDYWQSTQVLLDFRNAMTEDTLMENEYFVLCLELEEEALRFINLTNKT